VNRSNRTRRQRYIANEDIRDEQLRVVGPDGENLGILSRSEALKKAEEYELDLVLISIKADPSVARIIDLSKHKYAEQKRESEQRRGRKVEMKELQLKPNIDDHDLEVRIRRAEEFLKRGDKVKFTVKFHGRLSSKKDLGREKMDRVLASLSEVAEIESGPKMEGNLLITLLKLKK
jgi:translation initiation factor IF-3